MINYYKLKCCQHICTIDTCSYNQSSAVAGLRTCKAQHNKIYGEKRDCFVVSNIH